MYRQGDILFVACDEGAKGRTVVSGIVAEGEATGHYHRVVDGLVFEVDGTLHVVSDGGATVTHDEHDTLTLAPGTYRVVRQREYTPEEIRYVAD